MNLEDEFFTPKPLNQIDQIKFIEANKIEFIKSISNGDYFLLGHFPNMSIYPGLLMVEAVIQGTEILLQRKRDGFKLSNVSARFLKLVTAGNLVFFTVESINASGDKPSFGIKATGRMNGSNVMTLKATINMIE